MRQSVLVTGGNQGIGLAIVQRFAREGFATVLSGRRPDAVSDAVDKLRKDGLPVSGLVLDTGDRESIKSAIKQLDDDGVTISVLINNAGILPDGTLADMSDDDLTASFDINVLGPIWLVRALAPGMAERGYGRIVNVSSDWGSFAGGIGGPGAYGVTKAAMNASTVRLAKDLPSSIKINAMHPGWVRTRMGGSGAARAPEEAAETAFWLGTLPDDGPNGGFFYDKKEFAW
ncbi:MAG: SDR family NAD(P)-dependent oxidoreductase [Pseudomonadota bacterium]